MGSEWDIFECLPAGSLRWADSVSGPISARRKLRKLVASTGNEYAGIALATREIIFPVGGPAIGKRIFQIAYTEELCRERAELLRRYGCGVLSVTGNDAAKALLTELQLHTDFVPFVIIGYMAPQPKRKEMVDWLRSRYPEATILVLNPVNEQIAGADYNVQQNEPELWLPIVTAASSVASA